MHRKRSIHKYIATCLLLILSACAKPDATFLSATDAEIDAEIRLQKEMALSQRHKENNHIRDIYDQIVTKNADICKKKVSNMGFTLWNIDSFKGEEREIAEKIYNLDHVYKVSHVFKRIKGKYNIEKGDKIIAINKVDISSTPTKIKNVSKAVNKYKGKYVDLLLLRGDEEIKTRIKTSKQCDYGLVYYSQEMGINAYADGKDIFITRGMYRFVESDEQLAIVVGHEIGHNVMKHQAKSKTNRDIGLASIYLLDIAAEHLDIEIPPIAQLGIAYTSDMIYSVDFEREADYVGLYFAERAGYDTSEAINLWRRMAVEHDSSGIDKRSTHPATAERFVYLKKTHQEIADKRKNDEPLNPNMNDDSQEKSAE